MACATSPSSNAARVRRALPGRIGGEREEVLICPIGTQARDDGFDVTPAKLVTALITEHGAVRRECGGPECVGSPGRATLEQRLLP